MKIGVIGVVVKKKAAGTDSGGLQVVSPHSGQSSVRQAKLGVSDWVQVPMEQGLTNRSEAYTGHHIGRKRDRTL